MMRKMRVKTGRPSLLARAKERAREEKVARAEQALRGKKQQVALHGCRRSCEA